MTQTDNHSAIDVCNLTKHFDKVTALDHVSFSVNSGEMFFILGPSGCGKTTMLRVLAGLETPDSGTVFFQGKDMSLLPPHRRGAPMVFQNYALWPHLSVKDNIGFGLVERKIQKKEIAKRVLEAIKNVDLEGLAARMPGQLSGGQQQRVALARALVLNPDIMLFDEPLSNLDAKLRTEMREEIEKLHHRTNITFIYVTHDQTEALSLADRLIVMHDGKIRATGTPLDLYHRPPNIFCANFLGAANLVPGHVVGIEHGIVKVKTLFGVWHAVYSGKTALNQGDSVKCLIRPENLRPSENRAEGNRLNARVRLIRLNGSTVTVVLQSKGVDFKATLLNEYFMNIKVGEQSEWLADAQNTVVI